VAPRPITRGPGSEVPAAALERPRERVTCKPPSASAALERTLTLSSRREST
jgi:hypothetical protein